MGASSMSVATTFKEFCSEFGLRPSELDRRLLCFTAMIASFGLVMVASSSIDFSTEKFGRPWAIAQKQMIFLLLGMLAGYLVLQAPVKHWKKFSNLLLVLGLAVLALVLVPFIGSVANGARRWIYVGPISVQASELAKLCLVIFFASFLERHSITGRVDWASFTILITIILTSALMLLLEPDFGACVILCVSLGGMMFVAGVPFLRFVLLAAVGVGSAIQILKASTWRWERFETYLNPFADPYAGGYQLVNSLIAFGRGEWVGLGLGNSIQKLFFLPDAHTDFIFAIIAEEFGLIGASIFALLYGFFIWMILLTGLQALKLGKKFEGLICIGVGTMLGSQAFINMGVASGLLPTKGLTMPLVSYGGSSVVITCVLIALVLRVKAECDRVS